MPLVRGRYPVTNPVYNYLGRPSNVTQNDLALRSNAEVFGLGGMIDGAALTTQVMTVVAVPVQVGDTISQVQVRTGATAAATPTNSWAAVYAGNAPGNAATVLLAQSVDAGAAAIAASSTITFTLSTPQTVTNVNAPSGYWYVAVMVKAGTVPTLAAIPVAAAVAGPFFAGGATACIAASAGLTTAAPAALVAGTAQANVPIVYLS